MQPTLDYIQSLARQAGEILRKGYGQSHKIHHKGITDLVTEIDQRSENFLIDSIHRDFPSHAIVTEESGNLDGDDENCWYIDPLDGTVNYAHDVPLFCVSVGYVHHQQVAVGVIYDPMRDECFQAERGKGAWLNDSPIHVSDAVDLIHSLLVTGFPYDLWDTPQNNLEYFNRFSRLSQGVRRLGSAALDLCYVAAGRFDGFWEVTLKSWDTAAGSLIVTEAGGVVTGLNGDPFTLTPLLSILAANPAIHPLMLTKLKEPSYV